MRWWMSASIIIIYIVDTSTYSMSPRFVVNLLLFKPHSRCCNGKESGLDIVFRIPALQTLTIFHREKASTVTLKRNQKTRRPFLLPTDTETFPIYLLGSICSRQGYVAVFATSLSKIPSIIPWIILEVHRNYFCVGALSTVILN